MAKIPQHFLDELLSRTDIVELINRSVPLKKAGRDYMACCPFHNEKSPSFSVSQTKQFYHCFGCGAHGTAISFLMQHQRMEFREAVEELARNAGMEIPEEVRAGDPVDALAPLFQLNARAQELFREGLRKHPHAVEYLKKRGLAREAVNQFGIGYAPPGWSNLLDALREPALLEKVGLAIRRDDGSGHYDRFRDRIMFPIRDGRGRIIGFGGRALGDEKPKYLNSPESPLFHKGKQLYGLYELRQAVSRPARVLVVEGYMDTVMLAQQGIPEVMATLGTAMTEEHLQLLYKITDEVVFAFDGDTAGYTAATRALERAIPHIKDGVALKFLFLPEGEDPDTLVQREGRDAFLARVDGAQPLSEFLLAEISQGLDLAHVDSRAQAVARARVQITRMPETAYRSLFIEQLAQRIKLPRPELERLLRGAAPVVPPAARAPEPPLRRTAGREVRSTPVRRALQWLLESPALAQGVGDLDSLRGLDVPGVPLLVEVIELFQQQPSLNAAALLERLRGRPEEEHIQRLMESPLAVESGGAAEFADCLARLQATGRDRRYSELLRKPELTVAEKREMAQFRRTAKLSPQGDKSKKT